NRGALQTIRIDDAGKSVDFARSRGVIGQRYCNGSLYVALDAEYDAPIVALAPARGRVDAPPDKPFLVEARWRVWGVQVAGGGLRCRAQGFGPGEMAWRMPAAGRYRIVVRAGERAAPPLEAVASSDGLLRAKLPSLALTPVEITIAPVTGP